MNCLSHRLWSAHMADLKGKGIWYDNDNEPIQLTDQDDSHTIWDYQRSLIGKVLNPKKQNIVKLIQHMPTEWKLPDSITANDLGNGKFLFNFATEGTCNLYCDKDLFTTTYACLFLSVGTNCSWLLPMDHFVLGWDNNVVHDHYPAIDMGFTFTCALSY